MGSLLGRSREEGKKDPGPHLLSVLFSGGNLENPFFLLRRQMFIFSAASVILFQILKAFLPPCPKITILFVVGTHVKLP